MNNSREIEIKNYLIKHNLEKSRITLLPSDASKRRYFRIYLKGNISFNCHNSILLMDAPPLYENIEDFVKIDKYLVGIDLSAPLIFDYDLKNGFMLLEDFGLDNSFKEIIIKYPSKKLELYKKAIDTLIILQNKSSKDIALLDKMVGRHDEQILIEGVKLFFDWYPNVDIADKEKYLNLFKELFVNLNYQYQTLALRDYHVENLLFLQDREGVKQVGLLDFQDALISNPAYDLLSLLQDARIFVENDLELLLVDYYLANNDIKYDKELFINDYNILSIQRNLRILGIFHRLDKRDGKSNYLKYLENVKSYLKRTPKILDIIDNL